MVLFLNPAAQLGGAERSLLDMIASLRSWRPEWRLGLVVTGSGPLIERAAALGVEVEVLSLPAVLSELGDGGAGALRGWPALWALLRTGPAALQYAVRLRRLILEKEPDLIHSNGLKMHVLGAWARRRSIPLVWHVHDFVSRRPIMSVLLRLHSRRCSAAIANSRSVAADILRVCGNRTKVHLVYNAVDLKAFSPDGRAIDLDQLSGLPAAPEGSVRVGLVATLGWWKGHDTFLSALALLPPDLPVRGYVIGGPLYETRHSQHSLDRLREKAVALGLGNRVGFTGFIDDVPAAMRALDVVVHASTEPEAFGLVIIEGMATGRAVIASKAGGAAELIDDGRNALGHRAGDPQDLAECIARLVTDGELRGRLGSEGRATAERDFDRARLAKDLLPVYAASERLRDSDQALAGSGR